MRGRVLVVVAAVCLAAACSSSSSKKPAAAAPSTSAVAAAQSSTSSAPSPSPSPDINVGVMCQNLDNQTKDLADLVGKLAGGQSVSAFGIGIPIVRAEDAAKEQKIDHPGTQIDADLDAFVTSLDALDTAVTADKVDTDALGWKVADVRQAWKTLSLDCGRIGSYAFSNRL